MYQSTVFLTESFLHTFQFFELVIPGDAQVERINPEEYRCNAYTDSCFVHEALPVFMITDRE